MNASQPARQRLSFVLPEFFRQVWVSEAARTVWEPRFARIGRAWLDMEWLSVAAGIRECALIWISNEALPELISKWQAARLSAIQLKVGDTSGRGTGSAAAVGPPGMICVLVGPLDKIERLRQAWAEADHETVGTLLGYPSCCRAFFRDVWVEQRCVDTTWAMAQQTSPHQHNGTVRIELTEEIPPLANILWRWLGVRAVPHLPCRFDCSASIALGRRLLDIGQKAGFVDEVEWIGEILAWPVEWSALHGIAEVKSPLTKVSTRTDATAAKWTVQWAGTKYPSEGSVGLHFPYQKPKRPMLTGSRGYRRGIAHIVQQDQLGRHDHAGQHDTQPAWHYADNGFASARTMLELHQPIIELARSGLANDIGNVLDLGCGNGALLAKVCDGRNDLVPYGIDNNGVAVAHARLLLPRFAQNFVQGDLFDVTLWGEGSRRYTLALLMLGRLFEVPRDRALRMLDGLCGSCSRVLAYVYPDWNERTLQDAARQFGLDVEESGCATAAYLKTKGYGVGESAAIPRAGS